MTNRANITTGSPWEEKVGYSRAVKVGNHIFISGTVASDEYGNVVGESDTYFQAKYIFQKIEKVLKEAGASLKDVVRTRMFVTDINKWENVAKAHSEFFIEIKPASTMVEVSKLINEKFLVEIEVDAVINN